MYQYMPGNHYIWYIRRPLAVRGSTSRVGRFCEFPRKIPTKKSLPNKFQKLLHQKLCLKNYPPKMSEEKSLPIKTRHISTKSFSQEKFLPKNPWRGSVYKKISEETFSTKKCLKRHLYPKKSLKRYSPPSSFSEETFYTFFWRDIATKTIEENSLSYQKTKDIDIPTKKILRKNSTNNSLKRHVTPK